MKADAHQTVGQFLTKNKYLILVLLAGLILILLPGGNREATASDAATDAETRLQGALSRMDGVGEVYVLLAEENGRNEGYTGAVIVCTGASEASVRLRIVEAVSAFTGLGSDRIIVQKMKM